MNDDEGKTASSALAVTEKRPHRPGGCVGALYHILDWNRRFVKKKLFFKKLLPSARPKQAARKFGRDDKLPKLRLIADENCGGFPKAKKNATFKVDSSQKPGMRAPSLVARLMGLESIPAVQGKSMKASNGDKGAKSVSGLGASDCGHPKLEQESGRDVSRPKKIQKTGSFEGQPLSRFGTETLQFRSILSRSKRHRPKLIPPIKSHGMNSRRNSLRLIGAATRILEPGLQVANRAKCALAYSSPVSGTSKDEVILEESTSGLLNLSGSPSCHVTMARSLKGQPYQNCVSMADLSETSPNFGENTSTFSSPVSNNVNIFHGSENERSIDKSEEQSVGLTVQSRSFVQTPTEAMVEKEKINQKGEIPSSLTSQRRPDMYVPPGAFKHKAEGQNQILLGSDKIRQRYEVSSSANAITETNNFVASNRSLHCPIWPRMPVKAENCKCGAERKSFVKQDSSLSLVRKRSITNFNQQGESSSFASPPPALSKQRNRRDVVIKGINGTHQGGINGTSVCKYNNVNAFGSHSTTKQSDIAHTRVQKITSYNRSDKKISERSFPSNGGAIGAFIGQKMNDLTGEEEAELVTGGASRRTAAMILQELISALSTEGKSSLHRCSLSNRRSTFSTKENTAGMSFHSLSDIDHLSPGSVLEACFSNDSCLSSNMDDFSGLSFVGQILNHVSGVLLTHHGLDQRKLADAKQVLLNAELVFRHVALQNPNESRDISISHFLIHELETLSYGIKGIKDRKQCKEFFFDCVIEYLDSRYGLYSTSGLKASTRISPDMTADKLIRSVVEETRRWARLAGKVPDDIIETEMSRSLGKWTQFEIEVYEVGVEIAWDLLHVMLDEVVGHSRIRHSPH
ncbi:hypothetical protein NMG60_11028594 [Bertholletia excelsa]